MEIYKIPACWPTSFFHGIPLSDMLNKENFKEIFEDYKKGIIDNKKINKLFDFDNGFIDKKTIYKVKNYE
jgi:hypothetical protein